MEENYKVQSVKTFFFSVGKLMREQPLTLCGDLFVMVWINLDTLVNPSPLLVFVNKILL